MTEPANEDAAAGGARPPLKVRLLIVWRAVKHANHRNVARAAIGSHLVYYSLCFIEAHGTYGIAAGFCGLMLLIETILGNSSEGDS